MRSSISSGSSNRVCTPSRLSIATPPIRASRRRTRGSTTASMAAARIGMGKPEAAESTVVRRRPVRASPCRAPARRRRSRMSAESSRPSSGRRDGLRPRLIVVDPTKELDLGRATAVDRRTIKRGRKPSRLPLEGRLDPADVRLRGRLARARHEHDRTGRRRPRPSSAASRLRSRFSPRRWTPSSIRASRASWRDWAAWRSSTSRASRRATTSPTRSSQRIAAAPDDERPGPARRGVRPADPRRPRRPAIAEIKAAGRAGRRRIDPRLRTPLRAVLRRARRGPVPRPVAGQQRSPPCDRLRPAVARGVHALHADPGRRRQHDHAEAAFALMEQGAAAVFVGVGQAPRARPARCWASACRR